MDRAFQLALDPPRPVIFGLRLQPLTLGHLLLLERLGLPPFGESTFERVIQSVFCCAQRWVDSERNLNRWWFPIFCRVWSWRTRKADVKGQCRDFHVYLGHHMAAPTVKFGNGHFRTIGAPLVWRTLAALMHLFHMEREQALNIAMLEATALIVCRLEADEKVELWSAEDEDFWEWAQSDESRKLKEEALALREAWLQTPEGRRFMADRAEAKKN